MIHIQTRRAGLLVLAATVNDNRDVEHTWALTTRGAERRLLRRLDAAARALPPATVDPTGRVIP